MSSIAAGERWLATSRSATPGDHPGRHALDVRAALARQLADGRIPPLPSEGRIAVL